VLSLNEEKTRKCRSLRVSSRLDDQLLLLPQTVSPATAPPLALHSSWNWKGATEIWTAVGQLRALLILELAAAVDCF